MKVEGAEKTLDPVSMPEEIEKFLKYCEANASGLVLDLRDNGGGSSALMSRIYFMLANPLAKQLLVGNSYVNSKGNIPYILATLKSLTEPTATIKDEFFAQLFKKNQINQPVTNWLVFQDNRQSVQFFSKPIVALASSFCVSACEGFIHRLKATDRAKIIGEATSGTGFGFSSRSEVQTKFRDPFNMYEVRIPNHAFSFFIDSNDIKLSVDKNFSVQVLPFSELPLLENRPAIPNLAYQISQKDLNGFQSYIEFIDQVFRALEEQHH
jgi:hypothetical protein